MRVATISWVLVASLVAFGCSDDDDGSNGTGGTAGSGGTAGTGGTAGSGGAAGNGGGAGTTGATEIAQTPVVGVLSPYQDNVPNGDGSDLFPPNSVQAHWYVWNDRYVVLYRGYDTADPTGICPGNSIQVGQAFANISNSPWPSTDTEACTGAMIADEPGAGAFECGGLLYYVTEIPTTAVGSLWGTLELSTPEGFIGQTTFGTPTDLANTPEFEPGLDAYDLPPSTVDDLDVVTCP